MNGLLQNLMRKNWLQALVSLGPRVLVQVLLLSAYLYLFGLPALGRFEAKEVMIVKTTKDTNGIASPALTLAVRNQFDKDICYNKEASIEDCIEENTRNGSEILKRVIVGYRLNKEINLTKETLKEDFTRSWSGRYYTLNLDEKIGPNIDDDMLFLEMKANLKFDYTIFVHDPKYFLFNENPIALPTIMKRMRGVKKDSIVYKLELTEVNQLNLPSNPCNSDADYNFERCVRQGLLSTAMFVIIQCPNFYQKYATSIFDSREGGHMLKVF